MENHQMLPMQKECLERATRIKEWLFTVVVRVLDGPNIRSLYIFLICFFHLPTTFFFFLGGGKRDSIFNLCVCSHRMIQLCCSCLTTKHRIIDSSCPSFQYLLNILVYSLLCWKHFWKKKQKTSRKCKWCAMNRQILLSNSACSV